MRLSLGASRALVPADKTIEPSAAKRKLRRNAEPAIVLEDGRELTAEEQGQLQELTSRARAANQRGVELLLEMKEILFRAHEIYCRVGRLGEYTRWVAENLPTLSQRTAERYLKVHELFGKEQSDTLLKFEVTALYLLCEEKTPPEARRWAIDDAMQGMAITADHARLLIAGAVLKEKAALNGEAKGRGALIKAPRPATAKRPKPIQTKFGVVVIKPKDGVLDERAALKEAIENWQVG